MSCLDDRRPEVKRTRLRAYQLSDLKRIRNAFAPDPGDHRQRLRRVCYQAPTGSGKTVLFSEFVREEVEDGGRVIILAHRDEIVQQISAELRTLGVRHGIIAPGEPETRDRVQVASVMTLVRRLDRLRYTPSALVIDEAHHAVARTWLRIIEAFPGAAILGVTATPRRLDGKPLDDIFDILIIGPSITSLIDDEWLAPCSVFTPVNDPDLTRVRIRAGDYAVEQLSEVMSGGIIVSGAVAEYERLCPGAPAIVFCVDIAHSKLVAEAFRDRGYYAEHVDGETPRRERRDLIAALGDGGIDVLCNCGLVSEGLDVPGVEAAILLRPTKSLALYLQMVGRALRPGKDLAYILDHAGNCYRHGLPTARRRWNLHGKQERDSSGERLVRCPECGAVNGPGSDECSHCGAALRRERPSRVEVAGSRLVEAVEAVEEPRDDSDLADMTYRAALDWAAESDGVMRSSTRLNRVARARGYSRMWVSYTLGCSVEEVLEKAKRYRKQQADGE
jgi:DNA repair protein RadD